MRKHTSVFIFRFDFSSTVVKKIIDIIKQLLPEDCICIDIITVINC